MVQAFIDEFIEFLIPDIFSCAAAGYQEIQIEPWYPRKIRYLSALLLWTYTFSIISACAKFVWNGNACQIHIIIQNSGRDLALVITRFVIILTT